MIAIDTISENDAEKNTDAFDGFLPQMHRAKALCLYLVVGCTIGCLLVVTAGWLMSNVQGNTLAWSDLDVAEYIQGFLFCLPFAFIFGFIPALLAGYFIEVSRTTHYIYIHAFIVGAFVTLFFYVFFIHVLALLFAVVGGIAAVSSRYIIHRSELETVKKAHIRHRA